MSKEYNIYWWRTLAPEEQERILLRETSEPFAVKCIKDILRNHRQPTRSEIETKEALNEEIELWKNLHNFTKLQKWLDY